MTDLEKRVRELYRSRRIVGLANADAASLVGLLADEDVKFRFFVGDLIKRNGKGAIASLLIAARSSDSVEVRRSAVHLLGKIGRTSETDGDLTEVVVAGLKDEDPKVRRNAAIALGELGRSDTVEAVSAALAEEPFDWVRPSMILALGQIGGSRSAEVLADLAPTTAAETEALGKARDRVAVVNEPGPAPLVSLDGREVEFHCAPGLETVTCDAFERILGQRPRTVQNGSIRASVHALCDLEQVRSWREWLVLVAESSLNDSSDGCMAEAGIELLGRGLDTCSSLYANHETAPARFRIELRGKDTSHASRRKLVKYWVDQLKSSKPSYTNSPSHYAFELRVQRAKTKAALYLKLTEEPDTRFDYRVEDVPAAMHPATAAGIVQLADRRAQARVLDPFCGSGTLLFERLRCETSCGGLSGSDISGHAVEAAKSNLKASGEDLLRFRRGDVRTVQHEGPFDELISNLPYGVRTGSHEKNVEVYRALFDRLPEWLTEGAAITLVTQEIDLMTELFRSTSSVRLRDVQRVDTGGLQPGIFLGSYVGNA